jgi:hypothetical protein
MTISTQRGQEPTPSVTSAYSERARRRLMMAAQLLRLGPRPSATHDEFCAGVLASIRRLAAARQRELRALVDWVEAYEDAEERL